MLRKSEISETRTIDGFIAQLKQCKPLSEANVEILCEKAKEVFIKEENIVSVPAPVTI